MFKILDPPCKCLEGQLVPPYGIQVFTYTYQKKVSVKKFLVTIIVLIFLN